MREVDTDAVLYLIELGDGSSVEIAEQWLEGADDRATLSFEFADLRRVRDELDSTLAVALGIEADFRILGTVPSSSPNLASVLSS